MNSVQPMDLVLESGLAGAFSGLLRSRLDRWDTVWIAKHRSL